MPPSAPYQTIMDRLPETVLVRALVLSSEDHTTRRLGRLASLARFMAGPARVASLHTVMPGPELTRELMADPSIARHFRDVRLHAPATPGTGWTLPTPEGCDAHREAVELWRTDVEAVLWDARAARTLVLTGTWRAVDRAMIDLIVAVPWTWVEVDLRDEEVRAGEAAIPVATRLAQYETFLFGISEHVEVLVIESLSAPARDLGRLEHDGPENNPLWTLPWPRLQALSIGGYVDSAVVVSMVRNAPKLCDFEAGDGVYAVDEILAERGAQFRRATVPAFEHLEDQPCTKHLRHFTNLESLDWHYSWLQRPETLIHDVPANVQLLRVHARNDREGDLISACAMLMLGLYGGHWHGLGAIELLWTMPYPGQRDTGQRAVEALEQCCRARDVRFSSCPG